MSKKARINWKYRAEQAEQKLAEATAAAQRWQIIARQWRDKFQGLDDDIVFANAGAIAQAEAEAVVTQAEAEANPSPDGEDDGS